MISRQTIVHLLELAARAPSGDNSQPWRFSVRGETVFVHKVPERDNPVYNYRERGTFVALGAFIENFVTAAANEGVDVHVDLFPQDADTTVIAVCACRPVSVEVSERVCNRARAISTRATNRRVYDNSPLTSASRANILQLLSEIADVRSVFIENAAERQMVASAVSTTEYVMLTNRILHDAFYHDVRWSAAEEQVNPTGLLAATLELQPPQLAVFRSLRSWKWAHIAHKIGLPTFIARDNAKRYATGAAMIFLIVPDEDKYFLAVGRLMERLWLEVTAMGLSLQPVTAIPYLAQQVMHGDANIFSMEQKEKILAAYGILSTVARIDDASHETIGMIVRIGQAKPVSAYCSRKPLEISYLG